MEDVWQRSHKKEKYQDDHLDPNTSRVVKALNDHLNHEVTRVVESTDPIHMEGRFFETDFIQAAHTGNSPQKHHNDSRASRVIS